MMGLELGEQRNLKLAYGASVVGGQVQGAHNLS